MIQTNALREHAPMVQRMARRMAARLPRNVESDDLVQVGMLGLIEALARFDVAQGIPFAAYASQRIRGAMTDELRRCDWAPRTLRASQRHAAQAHQRLCQTLHREPMDCEMAQAMGMPLADYQRLRGDMHSAQVVCIDDVMTAAQAVQAEDSTQSTELAEAIARLPERQQKLLGMRYEHGMNFKEIGAVFGFTESRAAALHRQAVAWLCAKFKREGIA